MKKLYKNTIKIVISICIIILISPHTLHINQLRNPNYNYTQYEFDNLIIDYLNEFTLKLIAIWILIIFSILFICQVYTEIKEKKKKPTC